MRMGMEMSPSAENRSQDSPAKQAGPVGRGAGGAQAQPYTSHARFPAAHGYYVSGGLGACQGFRPAGPAGVFGAGSCRGRICR